MLRGSLAAAPVLMTVVSRPVLGQTTCVTASATTSAAPSGAARSASVCSGLTPQQWKAAATQWPTPYCGTSLTAASYGGTTLAAYQTATPYHCVTTGLGGTVFGELTMLNVIDVGEGGFTVRGLGRYIVAALLNARAGRTPVLSETGVRMMWNDLISRGYYEPTAGVKWGPAEIIAYLTTTMG